MTPAVLPISELHVVYGLILLAVWMFVTERVPFDVAALVIMAVLLITGILEPSQGFSGFSNPATITIAAMFVLSEGLHRTGALNGVAAFLTRLGERRPWLAIFVMMVGVSIISGFINNTAVVAIFIPVVINLAHELKMSASKILMPLSFVSMFGGVCTLVGTSTNLLVDGMARERGIEAFGMFEFAPLGVILLVAGFIYLFPFGIGLIPTRRKGKDLTADFRMHSYLTDVVIEPGFEHSGERLGEIPLSRDLDIDVLQVFKEREEPFHPEAQPLLKEGDVLRIRGKAKEIQRLLRREDVSLVPTKQWYDVDLERGPSTLVEAVVAPDSPVVNMPIRDADFPARFGAVILALRHHGRLQRSRLGEVRLSGGDSVLLRLAKERVQDIEQDPSFVVVSELGVPHFQTEKMPLALGILVAVVGAAALGFAPIVVTATAGAVLLLLLDCLSTEEAYAAINWKVIFLLAGVLPLGIAMDETGAAGQLSHLVISGLGELGPVAVCSGLFFLSMMLTNVISNNAAAALLAPIAIEAAQALEVSPRPMLVAVTVAASLCFMSPVGYQTNTLVYGPGQYRFRDFTKVGTPLNLLFWVLATVLIPLIWPFHVS